MNNSTQFKEALRLWTEVFMRRSMQDLMHFTREAGLSMSQLSTLLHLYHDGGCGVSDIGEYLGVSNPAASQLVDRLVGMGLLERSEDPDDRRVKRIAISGKGQALIRESYVARRRWMNGLPEILTPEEQHSIIDALATLTRAARTME